MTTVDTNQLVQVVDSLRQSAAEAVAAGSADAFEQFERQLSQFDGACREVQQALWADEARTTIAHIENGDPLTPADHAVIRTFLISDAERYVAMENNYQDWTAELQRLLGEMTARAGRMDRESIADLRGVAKDAIRLVPSIRNYLDERQRIGRCSVALDTLDTDSRTLLARILREDLASPNR